jgi:hypothetical protein
MRRAGALPARSPAEASWSVVLCDFVEGDVEQGRQLGEAVRLCRQGVLSRGKATQAGAARSLDCCSISRVAVAGGLASSNAT